MLKINKKKKIIPLIRSQDQKSQGIYVRLPDHLLVRITEVAQRHGFRDRSKTIRAIIESAFANRIC